MGFHVHKCQFLYEKLIFEKGRGWAFPHTHIRALIPVYFPWVQFACNCPNLFATISRFAFVCVCVRFCQDFKRSINILCPLCIEGIRCRFCCFICCSSPRPRVFSYLPFVVQDDRARLFHHLKHHDATQLPPHGHGHVGEGRQLVHELQQLLLLGHREGGEGVRTRTNAIQ